jgi:hypothetical protein
MAGVHVQYLIHSLPLVTEYVVFTEGIIPDLCTYVTWGRGIEILYRHPTPRPHFLFYLLERGGTVHM